MAYGLMRVFVQQDRWPDGLGMPYAYHTIYLLSYYFTNKRSLHVRIQNLEILTLIGEK